MIFSNISSLDRGKGLHYFLEAIVQLQRKDEMRFEIVGKASGVNLLYENELKDYIIKNNLQSFVEMIGFVNNMPEYLNRVDVVVLTSTVEESFGLVLLEGMAKGKIVIASNVGGVPEIVDDSYGNILVPVADTGALTKAFETVAGYSKEQKEYIAERNIEKIKKYFTLDKQVEKMSGLYRELCSK